jgi:hypothetical protein
MPCSWPLIFGNAPNFWLVGFLKVGLYLSLGPMLLCLNEQNLLKWHGIPAGLSVSPLISEVASMHFGGAVVHVAVARLVFHKSFRLFFFFFPSLFVGWPDKVFRSIIEYSSSLRDFGP